MEIFGILIVIEIIKFGKFANFRDWAISGNWLFYEFVNNGNFMIFKSVKLINSQNFSSFVKPTIKMTNDKLFDSFVFELIFFIF